MLPCYQTVQGYGEQEIVIEKSRFIGYVNRAESEEEAVAFIEMIKKKHHQATHNCSAYLIGEHDHYQKANDDGEPSGTAGVPMLEVLKKKGLKDVVVVVTRYFGGIKLGAGGLVRAYTQATQAGLQAAKLIERKLHQLVTVTVEYPLLGKVEHGLRSDERVILEEIQYMEKVTLPVLVPLELLNSFEEDMVNLTNGQCELDQVEQRYVDRIIEG